MPEPEPADQLSIAYLADPNSIHTRRWVGYFAGRGHRIAMIVPRGLEIAPGLPSEVAIERFTPYTARRIRPLGIWTAFRSLRPVLRRLGPDILHAHYLTANGWHAWMSRFHPYAISVWGSDVLEHPRDSRKSAVYARLALGAADLVTGDSQELVDAAISFGAHRDRAHLIQFGVDVDAFSPGPESTTLRARLGLEGRRVVFSPRTIDRLYHPLTVVDALAQLPPDVAVVMTRHGATESELVAVQKRVEALRLTDRVRILPTIPHAQMPDMYRLAEAVVSIPYSDATPVTLLEALACGVPTVATDLPSVREWLGDLDPDALVPVNDPTATARALSAVMARPAGRAAAIAARGRETVSERASYGANMAAMERLYLGLRDERRRKLSQAAARASRRGSRRVRRLP